MLGFDFRIWRIAICSNVRDSFASIFHQGSPLWLPRSPARPSLEGIRSHTLFEADYMAAPVTFSFFSHLGGGVANPFETKLRVHMLPISD
jgi:hypothetical protein